jgi:hypothetical protein
METGVNIVHCHLSSISAPSVMSFPKPFRAIIPFVLLMGCLLLGCWIGWKVCERGYRHREIISLVQFDQLRMALMIYHNQHGSFPPTKHQASEGMPVHSWRALLAPMITHETVRGGKGYDFSSEWNVASNLIAFGTNAPAHFQFRSTADVYTDFLAIGKGDAWPKDGPLKSWLITKGDDRFLIVEDRDSTIHWLRPEF